VQNRYLVTQYHQLDVLGRLITTTQHDQRQQPNGTSATASE
jgi:hypothetical protein